jgi:hypothetical protein
MRSSTSHFLAHTALVALLVFVAFAAWGYEKDTHFGLTYFLARSVGFPNTAALQIAIADWSVDLEPNTQPARNPISPNSQQIFERFHAFRTTRLSTVNDDSPSKVSLANNLLEKGLVKRNFDRLWVPGLANGNPGIALHFFQDVYAHAGYSSGDIGHALPDVHAVDYLSNNKWTAQAVAEGTLDRLEEFMRSQLQREPCPPDPARVRYIVQNLIAANPTHPLTTPDYDAAVTVLIKALPNKWLPEETFLRRPGLSEVGDPGAFRINSDGVVPHRPTGPRGEGLYADDLNITVRPIDYLLGESWKDSAEKDPRKQHVFFTVSTASSDGNAVDFNGKHEWKFVEYTPSSTITKGGIGPGEWHFSRTPSVDEMPKNIPKTFNSTDLVDWQWAKSQVTGVLKWHLLLHAENCKLLGEFYPGEMEFEKNTVTGERHAKVLPGKAGWGTPIAIQYQRDWPTTVQQQ